LGSILSVFSRSACKNSGRPDSRHLSTDGIGSRRRFFEPAADNDLLARAGYLAHEGKEMVDFVWGEHGSKWHKDKDGALPLQEREDSALFFSLIGVRKNTVPA